jgi:hypothetical protein
VITPRVNAPLRPQIEEKLREAGIAWDGGAITLMTMPRVLNYVFNPLSVYFCHRRDGELAALVHEVSNTFGERHFYVLPPATVQEGVITQACDKDFFVSPFLEMNLRYEFHVTPPDFERACGDGGVSRRGDCADGLLLGRASPADRLKPASRLGGKPSDDVRSPRRNPLGSTQDVAEGRALSRPLTPSSKDQAF